MRGAALEVARYRFRTTFHRRWGGYLTVILLVGLVGGLAMGSVAGARRTQSAYAGFLARSDSSDLQVEITDVAATSTQPYSSVQTAQLAHLPGVRRVAGNVAVLVTPVRSDGAPDIPPALQSNQVETVGSVHGEYFTQDRVAVTQGRLADPARTDEFVATAQAAGLLGWHVGESFPMGVFTAAQSSLPGFGTPRVQPYLRLRATLVGIVVLNNQVVRDEVDQYPGYVIFTPALTRRLQADAAYYTDYSLRLDHGSGGVATVEKEIINHLPPDNTYNFHVTSVVEGQVARSVKPESIALGVFGIIAALATLLIGGQAIGRQLRAAGEELEVMRGLGADARMTTSDGLIGALGALTVGSLLAAVVAVALSPLAPIGPVRAVDPTPAMTVDWMVVPAGLVVLVVGLGAVTVALAYRQSPNRQGRRDRVADPRASATAESAASAGLTLPAVTGIRFALERDTSRNAVPVRSALLGSVLAVILLVATLTFGSGLRTLVTHPRLYGWNWNYAIQEVGGGHVPPLTQRLVDKDRDVAAWTGYGFGQIQIDGQTVPSLLAATGATFGPPILSGHAVEASHQIVLGAATLEQLHVHIGDTVELSYGSSRGGATRVPPTAATVVGTATLPAIGNSGQLHTSMGTGALVSTGIEPASFRAALSSPDPNLNGPAAMVIRLRPGVPPTAGLSSLRRIAAATGAALQKDPNAGGTFTVLPVQQPAEIVNYRAIGAVPALLAAGVVLGAVAALELTLAASTRRRRRDLALLKSLGFTHRQLATTVAWQASVAAVVGVVVGIPLGITLGRWMWTLFAQQINAVPQPTVPVPQMVLVAVGALVLANLVAAIPGRAAARTPTAVLLRAE